MEVNKKHSWRLKELKNSLVRLSKQIIAPPNQVPWLVCTGVTSLVSKRKSLSKLSGIWLFNPMWNKLLTVDGKGSHGIWMHKGLGLICWGEGVRKLLMCGNVFLGSWNLSRCFSARGGYFRQKIQCVNAWVLERIMCEKGEFSVVTEPNVGQEHVVEVQKCACPDVLRANTLSDSIFHSFAPGSQLVTNNVLYLLSLSLKLGIKPYPSVKFRYSSFFKH